MVRIQDLKIPYESRKLSPKREGPFLIKEVLGPVTYRLTLPKQWKIHNVFHAALLTPFKETTFHGTTETRPPPNLVDGQQEYEVEAILTHQRYRGKHQYLVKWKGYNSSEITAQYALHNSLFIDTIISMNDNDIQTAAVNFALL